MPQSRRNPLAQAVNPLPAGSHRRRRRSVPENTPRPIRWFDSFHGGGGFAASHYRLVGLWLTLLLALLAEMPWIPRPFRSALLQVTVVGVLTFFAAAGPYQDDLRLAIRRGPNPLFLALLAWCVFSAVTAPYRAFAVAELLRMLLCGGVYFAAAYSLRRDELRLAAKGVLAIGAVVSLYGVIQYGAGFHLTQGEVVAIFGNHEQLGSFLVLLLPVAIAFALERSSRQREQIIAQTFALLIGCGLLLTRTRSAWLGGTAGLIVLSVLLLRYTSVRLTRSNKAMIVGPLLLFSLAFGGLIMAGQLAPLVSKRAATLTRVVEDASFGDRLHRWRAAGRMASERPLTGWGLGTFPVMQIRWTHQGDAPDQVLAHGTGHQNLAHDFWVQWTAETGGVGLALYVAVIAAFCGIGFRALRGMTSGSRRTLLIGCLAATVGGCVDAIGAPSYTFPGVSSLFWFWIGLGVASCRNERHEEPALPPTPRGVWMGALGIGVMAALIVLGVGYTQH